MPGPRKDISRIQLQRERFGIPDYSPPAPEPDLSIRGALAGVFRKLDAQLSSPLRLLADKWPEIAGAAAPHSRPGRLADTVLFVYVDSSAWLAEISRLHAGAILGKVRAASGGAVRTVRYQVNPDRPGPELKGIASAPD